MRISTAMIFDSGLRSMEARSTNLLKTQQQLSSGRRVLTPADDPVAAARALEVSQAQGVNANQATTRNDVKSSLGISDNQLASATTLMQRVGVLAVQAGSGTNSASDLKSISTELRARFQEMVALANSRDGTGLYLFGGYQTNNQPFAGSVENGVTYSGDDGARALGVSGSRQLAISDSGNSVFMAIKNGNGVFATSTQNEKSTIAPPLTINAGTVSDSKAWISPTNSGNLQLKFWTDPVGNNYYDLVDVPTGNSLFTGTPSSTNLGFAQMVGTATSTPGALGAQGDATGSVALPASTTITAGVNDKFQVAVDGNAAVTVTLTPGTYTPAALAAQMQTDINADATIIAQGVGVGVVANGANQLVVTSNTVAAPGVPSTVTLATANTFANAYTSGAPIALASAGTAGPPPQPAFNYGASVIVSGTPANGDTFSIQRTASGGIATGAVAVHQIPVMDKGMVTDPLKWASAGNSGNMEVRFWVDTQGSVGTAGQSVGTVDTSTITPMVIAAGTNDQFSISVDGAAAQTVTIPPGSYATPASLAAAVQSGINALASPPVAATVSLNATNQLVVTSAATGVGSSVTLAAGPVAARDGLATFFGAAPTATAGAATGGAADATYYDLVDATTGKSMFTGAASTAGGATNTFTHAFSSGSRISLSSAGLGAAQTFDFGASVKVTGTPSGGDTFTIKASDAYYGNGTFVTAPKMAAAVNAGSGIIDVGNVTDASKWNQAANSRNLEVRFWKDTSTTPGTTYYDLVDAETEKSLFSNSISTAGGISNTFTHKFTDGDAIPFTNLNVPYAGPPATTVSDFGISVTISGTPASGDVFKVQASQSVSVFDTMTKLITSLENGTPPGSMGNIELSNTLGSVLSNLSQIQDNFGKVRASIGSRLAEVDDLDTVGQNLDLQYSKTLSGLQDLDYAAAITQYTQNMNELQAAQSSYAKISQLSLFDYIK